LLIRALVDCGHLRPIDHAGTNASPGRNGHLLCVAAGALLCSRIATRREGFQHRAAVLVRRGYARYSTGRPPACRRNARIRLARGVGGGDRSGADRGQGSTIAAAQSDTFEAVKHRILIVEDEPAISDNIQFVLESEGLETIRVATGLAAWPILDESRIDLIIL